MERPMDHGSPSSTSFPFFLYPPFMLVALPSGVLIIPHPGTAESAAEKREGEGKKEKGEREKKESKKEKR